MEFFSPAWWGAFGAIMMANILLSGDNAVVIALAARSLPPHQQKLAIFWGSGAAIVMRIVLTIIAVQLLALPYLKIIGGVLLLYIGVTLMLDDGEEDDHGAAETGIWAAVRTILIADLVMSLDNVLAVAAAAKGDTPLLIIGLAVSIPLIIFGSTMLLKIMERFPIIITAGAALLGYLAGQMILTDPAFIEHFGAQSKTVILIAEIIGAAIVVLIGLVLQRRARSRAVTQAQAAPTHQ